MWKLRPLKALEQRLELFTLLEIFHQILILIQRIQHITSLHMVHLSGPRLLGYRRLNALPLHYFSTCSFRYPVMPPMVAWISLSDSGFRMTHYVSAVYPLLIYSYDDKTHRKILIKCEYASKVYSSSER